jgi:thymidylate synthase ThyX
MDIGGFRDLHRHRNCVHILKPISPIYGFDIPAEVEEVGLGKRYWQVMKKMEDAYWKLEKKYPGVGEYILPQATRKRFLMKISPWELQYVSELRSRPQGHFSYREISYLMYKRFAEKYPAWAKHIRVTDPRIVDFFKR